LQTVEPHTVRTAVNGYEHICHPPSPTANRYSCLASQHL